MTHKKLTIAEAIETFRSQKVTPQFAIDYLLDDCEDCPENKDGECVTESHCFEVKQMCIKALRGELKGE